MVFQAPGAQAGQFSFTIKIYEDAVNTPNVIDTPTIPSGYSLDNFYEGVNFTVKSGDVGNVTDFSAFTALQWYCQINDWDFNASSSGWINTFLGLGTYQGTNGSWIYWAQYHFDDSGNLVFNNTTLDYITTADSSQIVLVFWASPNSGEVPVL